MSGEYTLGRLRLQLHLLADSAEQFIHAIDRNHVSDGVDLTAERALHGQIAAARQLADSVSATEEQSPC
jgi:hypothetical protein